MIADRFDLCGDLTAWPSPIEGRPVKWAEIDAAALAANAAALAAHAGPEVAVMAMVKANGYGHGAVLASRCMLAGGARWLGVSSPEEAMQLRGAGIEAPMLIVGWSPASSHRALIAAGVDITVYDLAEVEALATRARATGRPARVHLKVDSGMSRLGAPIDEVHAQLRAIRAASPHLRLAGVFTHFADADAEDPDFTLTQHDRFLPVIEAACDVDPDVLVHCSNSAATLRFPEMHHDLVRPGIALYGYAPPESSGVVELRPALTLAACITQVKTVRAGDTVGYGRTWTATRDTRLATVAAGYADGVHRSQSNHGHVVIAGVRCPIVGRVSMDMISVDISAVDGAGPGDEAIVIGGRNGSQLGADEVGEAGGTVAYEVLCAVSARVPRILV
ncbi:MAG TPA: alanine racemase [Candidatus Dormibacteraeota bacterium]|jgi:alanine racemase|nr:alanine racemase [Candidatus Dormibacteraeota bacterium]